MCVRFISRIHVHRVLIHPRILDSRLYQEQYLVSLLTAHILFIGCLVLMPPHVFKDLSICLDNLVYIYMLFIITYSVRLNSHTNILRCNDTFLLIFFSNLLPNTFHAK
jgi:hypothetical protein